MIILVRDMYYFTIVSECKCPDLNRQKQKAFSKIENFEKIVKNKEKVYQIQNNQIGVICFYLHTNYSNNSIDVDKLY